MKFNQREQKKILKLLFFFGLFLIFGTYKHNKEKNRISGIANSVYRSDCFDLTCSLGGKYLGYYLEFGFESKYTILNPPIKTIEAYMRKTGMSQNDFVNSPQTKFFTEDHIIIADYLKLENNMVYMNLNGKKIIYKDNCFNTACIINRPRFEPNDYGNTYALQDTIFDYSK